MVKRQVILLRFAKKLRHERTRSGLSQESLASGAGLSRNYIGMIERGEANLTLGVIEQIAQTLHMESWELLKF